MLGLFWNLLYPLNSATAQVNDLTVLSVTPRGGIVDTTVISALTNLGLSVSRADEQLNICSGALTRNHMIILYSLTKLTRSNQTKMYLSSCYDDLISPDMVFSSDAQKWSHENISVMDPKVDWKQINSALKNKVVYSKEKSLGSLLLTLFCSVYCQESKYLCYTCAKKSVVHGLTVNKLINLVMEEKCITKSLKAITKQNYLEPTLPSTNIISSREKIKVKHNKTLFLHSTIESQQFLLGNTPILRRMYRTTPTLITKEINLDNAANRGFKLYELLVFLELHSISLDTLKEAFKTILFSFPPDVEPVYKSGVYMQPNPVTEAILKITSASKHMSIESVYETIVLSKLSSVINIPTQFQVENYRGSIDHGRQITLDHNLEIQYFAPKQKLELKVDGSFTQVYNLTEAPITKIQQIIVKYQCELELTEVKTHIYSDEIIVLVPALSACYGLDNKRYHLVPKGPKEIVQHLLKNINNINISALEKTSLFKNKITGILRAYHKDDGWVDIDTDGWSIARYPYGQQTSFVKHNYDGPTCLGSGPTSTSLYLVCPNWWRSRLEAHLLRSVNALDPEGSLTKYPTGMRSSFNINTIDSIKVGPCITNIVYQTLEACGIPAMRAGLQENIPLIVSCVSVPITDGKISSLTEELAIQKMTLEQPELSQFINSIKDGL